MVEIYLLDPKYNQVKILDDYISVLWIDRYNQVSTFELFSSSDYLDIDKGSYLYCNQSQKIMIVEDRFITTDNEEDVQISITGRSLESILGRRIVWEMTTLTGSLQDGIQRLINDAIINPKDSKRKIPNFIFVKSTDKRITDLKIDVQVTGDNLLEVIEILADLHEFGFKITYNYNTGNLEFRLFMGTDRSVYKDGQQQIVYSPFMGNLLKSSYTESISDFKNVALVAGEGEGTSRKTRTIGTESGLKRYELFVDARDITSQVDGVTITNDKYQELLKTRGDSKLLAHDEINDFEAEVENTPQIVLNKDVFLGDVVHVENEYGRSAKTRMTEIIIASDTQNGFTMIPTFKEDNKKEE